MDVLGLIIGIPIIIWILGWWGKGILIHFETWNENDFFTKVMTIFYVILFVSFIMFVVESIS